MADAPYALTASLPSPRGRQPRHVGKKMSLSCHRLDPLVPDMHHDTAMDAKAAIASNNNYLLHKVMSDSRETYVTKKMYTTAELGRPQPYNVFVKYGSFPPPEARGLPVHEASDAQLRQLQNPSHARQRARDVDSRAAHKSATQKQFEKGKIEAFYNLPEQNDFDRYDMRGNKNGLLGALTAKSGFKQEGKRAFAHAPPPDRLPIPGFRGVGVGQEDHFEQIQSRPHRVQPLVHISDTGHETDAPDPHPHGLRKVECAPPKSIALLRNQHDGTAEAVHGLKHSPSHYHPVNYSKTPQPTMVIGFGGMGVSEPDAGRSRGRSHVQPNHWEPRKTYSSLDFQ
jgi:hypothetical protein